MKNTRKSSENAKKEKMDKLTATLENGIKEVMNSENYIKWLKTAAMFHGYSFNNTLLIYAQAPGATRVAGFKTWEKLGRKVKKGEHGIQIFTPRFGKVTEENEQGEEVEHEYVYFRPTTIFDISQTEGKELPALESPIIGGKVKDFEKLFKAVESASPAPVTIGEIEGPARGYYRPKDNTITVKSGMSEVETIKTLVHETAHAKIIHEYREKPEYNAGEVQAESVAYIVSTYLGLGVSDYSFNYIASWSVGDDLKRFKESLEIIQKTANAIISDIEKKLS